MHALNWVGGGGGGGMLLIVSFLCHISFRFSGVNCAVCKENCVPGILYRRHYGVICCEACKCFFRRTVQMNRDYKCRFGGCCYIGKTTENFKQMCQACRFNQCIQAGMRLECESTLVIRRYCEGQPA